MLFSLLSLSVIHFYSDMENTKIIQKKAGIRKPEAVKRETANRYC